MVLRDSLGGNCQTAMIATISLELVNIGETLSTCRFSQRVACIANYARRNEEIDDKTLIKRLKKKVADLESEISCLKMSITEGGEQSLEEVGRGLSEEDRTLCSQIIRDYLSGRLTDPVLAGIQSPYRFRECLRILKKMVFKNYFQPDSQAPQHQRAVTSGHSGSRPRGRRQDRGRSLQEGGEAGERTAVFTSPRHDVQVLQFTDVTGDSHSSGTRPAAVEAWTEGKDGATTHSQPSLQGSGSGSHHRDAVANGNHDAPEDGMGRPSRETSAGLSEADWDQILGEKARGTSASKSHSPGKPLTPGSSESRPQGSPTGPRRRYKSPFERKREKEIGKLSRQLEELVGSVETKESSLQQLQSAIKQEEMDVKENTIRVHLQVTEEKVADQRAYIRQLQDTEADPALLDQEKLVERQLSKKKARLKMRLAELLEERGKAPDGSHASEDKLDPRKVIEEKISVYKKRDGSLNTRQVFEMLQKEQKKQKKHQDRVEREEILTKSRQLELREEATRQRLRELKEMLRLSQAAVPIPPPTCLPQSEQPARPSSQPAPSARSHALSQASFTSMDAGGAFPASNQTSMQDSGASQPPKARSSAKAAEQAVQNGHGREEDRTGSRPGSVAPQSGDLAGGAQDAHPRPGSSKSAWSLGSAVPDSNFYHSRRSSQTPSDKWDSAYSTRPQTAQTSVSQGLGQSGSETVGGQPSSGQRLTSEHSAFVAPSSAVPASVGAVATSPVREPGIRSSAENQRENHSAFTASSSSSQSVNYYGQTLSHSMPPQRGSGSLQDSGEGSKVRNGGVRTDTLPSSSASASASNPVQGPREPSPEKIMPSEYVYRMGVKENFDARRMGLSSQTFDAALSTMLDGLGDDYYDQYARQGVKQDRQGNRGKNKGGREQQRRTQKRKERKVETEEPEEVDEFSKLKKVWGAESKYSSVAARLANFLDSASESEEEGPRLAHKPPVPRADRQSRSRNRVTQSTAAGSFDAKLAEFQDFDTDMGPPKVTALRETEREVAYMSKASAERHRIAKIRQARKAAEVIQRHWRKYRARR